MFMPSILANRRASPPTPPRCPCEYQKFPPPTPVSYTHLDVYKRQNRTSSLAYDADVVIAVLAPLDVRIERAVASGFDEADVRRRIARQITDADRIEER